jgi:hypothetical protein
MQHALVVIYQRFETTYPLKMVQKGALETSVNNYQPTLPNILEEGRHQLALYTLRVTLTGGLRSCNIPVSWNVAQCHWVMVHDVSKSLQSSESPGTTHPTTLCHIPEESNLKQYCCDSLESQTS